MEKRELEQIKKDIEGARDLIMHPPDRLFFDTYSNSFLFGTENQEEINKVFPYKDKKILTPASSGDSYLGAVYYEAHDVDLFDINRLTKPITYLKIASILTLSYEEFLHFFIPTYQENNFLTSSQFKDRSTITSSFWDFQT